MKIVAVFMKASYDNNVHFEGVSFISGPHLVIIGPSGAVNLI